MTDQAGGGKTASTAGLMLAQQVLLEALVSNDAIGYHQLRDVLAGALAQLRARGEAPAEVLQPLERMLASLEVRHAPRAPAADWTDWLRENELI